ncbi:ectonucleotide pyrophosphatase/phosphodiesterase [Qipengyuania sphaerica]|uniref:alkaline phosphatase family protein n=1 Tax=Qipengyuania sphaerica TaxID=2867243 RepID=UPI001C86CCEE|nr:ectonucleotide pyrophosphatase/phosphodiesterase [Qipengyuania sphaerica]MBX7540751.1 ectonucleotide pyrophosphatase/phosphodiesterase [Qipengyuania sphaerica]
MNKLVAALALGFAAILPACAPQVESVSAVQAEQREPVTILVAIDGFHPSYLERGLTPTLSHLAETGVSAPMRPSFPTKTFPNFYTLVTGLVPDHHGITANKMEDASRPGDVFTQANVDPYWWSEAKPLWVEAEQAGIRSAAMFWPGSAVPWGGTAKRWGPVEDGILPSDWQAFSMQVSNTQRVNSVLDWLRRPEDIRPEFVTLYFDTIDTAGHDAGPVGEEIEAALRDVDGHIANLVSGLEKLGQPANIVIVSDHGMAPTSSERVIALDEVVDSSLYRLIEAGAYATFEPAEGKTREFREAILADHEHMTCWAKGDIPERYKYGTHRRIPPYFCLPETGWTIATSAPTTNWTGGNHGYDNYAPEMQAIFIANGPEFAEGLTLPIFDNTAVAPLLRRVIGLAPSAKADGDPDALLPAIRITY